MKKNKVILYTIIIVVILFFSIGITFALYNYDFLGSINELGTGTINFKYIENDKALQIVNPNSVSDDIAKNSSSYFEFTISAAATGKIDTSYYIYLTTDINNDNNLNNYIKAYLTKVTETEEIGVINPTFISSLTPFDVNTLSYNSNSSSRMIYSNYFTFNNDSTLKSITYRYRMWIDSNYLNNIYNINEENGVHEITTSSINYKVKINVKGTNGKPITIK